MSERRVRAKHADRIEGKVPRVEAKDEVLTPWTHEGDDDELGDDGLPPEVPGDEEE